MPKNAEPIKGKIARIITKKNVVINRGSRDGVENGMRFIVRLRTGTIIDPDDPANMLGELSFTKANLSVTTVYDGMSYCTIETTGLSLSGLSIIGYPNVEDPMFDTDDWLLRRGDEIEQIV